MPVDMTGVWDADDGGIYFVKQDGSSLSWLGVSDDGGLAKGLSFCNVFRATLAQDSSGIWTATGRWADVPRGQNLNHGELTVRLDVSGAGDVTRISQSSAGSAGFGAQSWTRRRKPVWSAPTGGSSFEAPLEAPYLSNVDKNVYKWLTIEFFSPVWGVIAHESLADNLELIKDSVTLFGFIQARKDGLMLDDNFPSNEEPTYQNFRDENSPGDVGGTQHDGDVTFKFIVNQDFLPDAVLSSLPPSQVEEVRRKIANQVEAEIIMFGRWNVDGSTTLLPGWGDTNGNSVLINGQPVNGNVEGTSGWAARSIAGVSPTDGQPVRVCGQLVFDKGHPERGLEIHPVYSVDFIAVNGDEDLTGVWGDAYGATYYLHVIGASVWGVISGAPSFQATANETFASVFVATREGDVVNGELVAVPAGNATNEGAIQLTVDSDRVHIDVGGQSPLAGRRLQKLYDRTGHPCVDLGSARVLPVTRSCEVDEIEGGVAQYAVVNRRLTDLPGLAYAWQTSAGTAGPPDGAQFQVSDLPAAGTKVTVSVVVTTSDGCQYSGKRTFTTLSRERANLSSQWCQSLRRLFEVMRDRPEPPHPNPPPDLLREVHQLAERLATTSAALLEATHAEKKR